MYLNGGKVPTIHLACTKCNHTWGAVQSGISCQNCGSGPSLVKELFPAPNKDGAEPAVFHFGDEEATAELLRALINKWGYPRVHEMLHEINQYGRLK